MAGDLRNTTTSQMAGTVRDFSVQPRSVNGITEQDEIFWDNPHFTTYYGYYKEIPEIAQCVNALVMFTTGRGFLTDAVSREILEHVKGNGKQTFIEIIQNFLRVYFVNGEAYLEIIKDKETNQLLNLKNLNPQTMRVVYGKNGMIKRYEQRNKEGADATKWKPQEIFHMKNKNFADELGGFTPIETCKKIIDMRNEAMQDYRRVLHRSSIRVMYVDINDPTKTTTLRTQYAEGIAKGEILIIPAPKGREGVEFEDLPSPPVTNFLSWIQYLENFFYQAFGVNPVVAGNVAQTTEAASQTSMMVFEQVYIDLQKIVESAIWNQLFFKIEFLKPVSLMEKVATDEAKNTGQMMMQPGEGQV